MPRFVASERFAATADFRLSDASAQTQNAPVFAALPGGGFVAVWPDQTFSNASVRAQIFDRNGHEVGAEFSVANGGQPSVAALPSGGFVVTWGVENPFPANQDLEGQIFDANGGRVGPAFTINTTTDGFQQDSVVTALTGGGFVVTWLQRNDGTFDNIRGQVFAADGTKIGGEFIANDALPGIKEEPDVIGLAGGGLVIAWSQAGAEQTGDGNLSSGSRAQLFDASGNKVGSAFALNTIIPGVQQNPDLAALPGGGFVATWSDDGNPFTPDPHPENKGIWMQIFDSAGAKIGAAVHVSTLGPIGQGSPDVEIIPGTGFIITWQDGNATAENGAGHLRAQLFDFAGDRIGEEFPVNPGLDAGQLQVDLTVLTTGAFVVGWTNRAAPQFNDEDVRARIFFPTILGTEGNDSFAGTANRDFYLGKGGDDQISGGAEDDGLAGGTGNDVLDGGAGNDDLAGGAGDDIYFVDSAGDLVAELAGEGRDVIYASVSYGLAAGSEVEILSTVSQAATTAIGLTGNALAQEIYGNAGANFIDGGGGADYLAGLGGNDTYIVGTGTAVAEAAGQGRDVVYARSNHVLSAGAEAEILSVLSQAATTPLQLTGNALAQEIYGNAGANFLDGGGGADYLAGLGGNDTYIVDTGTAVAEAAGQGRDVVYARSDYVLSAGADVEILSALSQSATTALQLTGNAFAQEIYGNDGANFIDGGGAADYLAGLGGNDVYIVDSADDFVFESLGGGRDVVYARASYALGASQEIEVLSAQSQSSTNAIDLSGNNLANELYGNEGANTLNGGGGADYLMAFGGADTFQFTTTLGGGNVDALADFNAVDDTIALDDAVFAGLTPGALPASAFVAGSAAGDADDRIIYNSANGQILFDADGNGAGLAVLFATVQAGTTLTASDFTVI